MAIKLVDLGKQYESIKDEIDMAIKDCIDKTRFIGGPPVDNFAKAFATYCETSYCAPCANGTDALEIVLKSMQIGPGDEVLVPAFTFFATVEAIVSVGAIPVLVDIDPIRYTISPSEIEAKINDKTKAIIVVHLYGQMADMDPIMALAGKNDLMVIEDAAQAHGAFYKGKRAGSIGNAGTFSFYPGKNLGAYGDGGAIVTNDQTVFERSKKIANHGRLTKYSHDLFGRNSRMDSIQAAILNVKLKYLDEWNQKRQRVALNYNKYLSGIEEISLPVSYKSSLSIFHLYVIRLATEKRSALIQFLKENGVETGVHYPVSMSKLVAMEHFKLNQDDYLVANEYMDSVLSLPTYPELTEGEIERIASLIRQFMEDC